MRSERYKMIQQLVDGNMFVVTDRVRYGDTVHVTARIINSMFFQLTQEEIVDGINGYMGCCNILTQFECVYRGGEFVDLEITMKDVQYAKSSSSSPSSESR